MAKYPLCRRWWRVDHYAVYGTNIHNTAKHTRLRVQQHLTPEYNRDVIRV